MLDGLFQAVAAAAAAAAAGGSSERIPQRKIWLESDKIFSFTWSVLDNALLCERKVRLHLE